MKQNKDQKIVLVVDDEVNIRETLSDMLSINGYRAICAEDGEDGINVALEENPDIIVTDVMMPKLNGLEMVKRIRSFESLEHIPIIFLSAKSEVDDVRQGLGAGGDDYIIKPFRMEEVLTSVEMRLSKVEGFKKEAETLKMNVKELSATNEHLMTATFRERDLRKKLQETLEELERTKKQVEKQNLEIKDSINYSEKIQRAIIPQNKVLKELFKDSFMLVKPRDIVSGDFPWMARKDKYVYIGVVDCTGHGVPGAMLSIIGNLLLNEVVSIQEVLLPSEILLGLNNSLYDLFKKSDYGNQIIGGMDVALVRVNLENNDVEFSGAFRPLHRVTKTGEIISYKGTRRSIGGFYFDSNKSFEDVAFRADEGDTIYIYSDGYQDQLSVDDRKFGRVNFEHIISELVDQEMGEICAELEVKLHEWRSGVKQIDDILVIGLRF